MAGVGKRTYLRDVNPYLICLLCRGYLIDATTVVECLHSFCRSCILKHLNSEARCPSCNHILNKAKPNIKADKALQDIVYKLVPGLYHKEMRKRREFYKKHPEHAEVATPEQRGEDVSGRLIFAPEDAISLSLEYLPPGADPMSILLSNNDVEANQSQGNNSSLIGNKRYLQCPALVTIAHLKKFLVMKYGIDVTKYTIEICHRRAPLPEHWTLMDVAYIYAWKRNAPMRFFYRVSEEEQMLQLPMIEKAPSLEESISVPTTDSDIVTKNDISTENGISTENDIGSEDKTVLKDEPVTLKIDEKMISVKQEETEVIEKKTNEAKVENLITNSPTSVAVPISASTPVTSQVSSKVTPAVTTSLSTNILSTSRNEFIKETNRTTIKISKKPVKKYEVHKNQSEFADNNKSDSNDSKNIASPEFSVVSIGDGQNSNGVKITLKQCSPNSTTNGKKPTAVSNNVVLRTGQNEKDSSDTLLQQLPTDIDKQQIVEKQGKQKRRVTFMENPTKVRDSDVPKVIVKSPVEQPDKKQFLQAFQLAAKEPAVDCKSLHSNSKANANTVISNKDTNSKIPEDKTAMKNVEEFKKILSRIMEDSKSNNKNPVQKTNNKFGNTEARILSSANNNSTNNLSNLNSNGVPASKIDVYNFPNEPTSLPAGAVKRKCPPGLPIYETNRKKPKPIQSQTNRKSVNPIQNAIKSPRKSPIESDILAKKPNLNTDPGPSQMNSPILKSQPNPILSTDTRNLLDGCGLNIPASLSITLTAPKSPSSNSLSPESTDSKDNRKGTLSKMNPSITLNDRSVDTRVLKALKSGQIRMPAPAKPRQTKVVEREMCAPRQIPTAKRKRDQDSQKILDLSGGKKMDIHPLRIPQPLTKLKPKPLHRENLPSVPDQGQVITMGEHRYYRAPPGSLTPAARRVPDGPFPTPGRTPVYAPTGLSGMSPVRSNNNLSSVFPSLQSLYVLSQSPNLQQFQMRLPRLNDNNPVNNASANDNSNIGNMMCGVPNKSHLAAQCAPIKPARSSAAPLAVPLSKNVTTSSNSLNRPVNDKTKIMTSCSNISKESSNSLTVQTRFPSTTTENSVKCSPRSNSDSDNSTERRLADQNLSSASQETCSAVKNVSNEPDNKSQQHNQDAASPRVSSTASPSPPPGDTNVISNDHGNKNNTNNLNDSDNSTNDTPTSTASKNDSNIEVTSSKSPASPDSSSIAVENCTAKNNVELREPTPNKVTADDEKSFDSANANGVLKVSNAIEDKDKNDSSKTPDTKQMTSEMLQKRLLAAFPTNEWASNPIAAEHLGNFLKSLNASVKTENRVKEKDVDSNESQNIGDDQKCGDENIIAKTKIEVKEST